MKRLVLFLVLVWVLSVVPGSSAATPVAAKWGSAIALPGLATLDTGGAAGVNSVSCAGGDCAAGGYYTDGSGQHGFVASETNGVWGNAIGMPGMGAVNSVSCGAAGNCVAADGGTDLVSETSGVWANSFAVAGLAALSNFGGGGHVSAVSCAAAGDCAVAGTYALSSCAPFGPCVGVFAAIETNGAWGDAVELLAEGNAQVSSISCSAAGECAVGVNSSNSGHISTDYSAAVFTETSGVWSLAGLGINGLNLTNPIEVKSVSCDTAGNCAAGGYYKDDSGRSRAFVASETNGVWGSSIDVPGLASLSTASGTSQTSSVSCAAGDCVAAGYYTTPGLGPNGFVATETNGVWGTASEVPGVGRVDAVSCYAVGNSAAAGGPYLLSETNGEWGGLVAFAATGVSCDGAGYCAAGGGTDVANYGYSVVYDGNGATGGSVQSSSAFYPGTTVTVLGAGSVIRTGYTFTGWNAAADGSGTAYQPGDTFSMPASDVTLYAQWTVNAYPVAYVGTGATAGSAPVDGSSPHNYGSTVTVLGAGSLTRTGYSFNGWNTKVSGGGTSYQAGATFPMPASAVTLYAQWARNLSAGTTTCNGTYAGTGSAVVVPAFATCTLVPGTHLTSSVTVKPRGTLHVNRVTIGGKLSVSGSATVCGSKMVGAVVATGGSFVLGGPACAGNTIASGSVLVTNDPNNVWVWNNAVRNGHNLSVKYAAGATDSIIGNNVSGNLLVASSGPPVDVSHNHAATASCVNNKGLTGSGNVAKGKNTCPH